MTARKHKRIGNDGLWGAVFLAPLCAGLLLFVAVPIVAAVVLSFTRYDLINLRWSGLRNYSRLFDPLRETQFFPSIGNVAIFAVSVTALCIIVGLVLAFVLNRTARSGAFKAIYYIPIICSVVATTSIWGWLYNESYGPIVKFLGWLGIDGYKFFSPAHVLPSMIFMCVWGGFGTSMLLYFAALKNIPKYLYEAAEIDGAGPLVSFLKITVPMVSPTTFYLLLTGLIGNLQIYSQFLSIGLDGYTPVLIIYNYAGHGYGLNYGYASALGVFYGLIVGAIAFVNFKLSKFWVGYDD